MRDLVAREDGVGTAEGGRVPGSHPPVPGGAPEARREQGGREAQGAQPDDPAREAPGAAPGDRQGQGAVGEGPLREHRRP